MDPSPCSNSIGSSPFFSARKILPIMRAPMHCVDRAPKGISFHVGAENRYALDADLRGVTLRVLEGHIKYPRDLPYVTKFSPKYGAG